MYSQKPVIGLLSQANTAIFFIYSFVYLSHRLWIVAFWVVTPCNLSRRHNPEGHNPHFHCHENLIFHIFMVYLTTTNSSHDGWLVKNELERMWKEAVIAEFKSLSWFFLNGLRKTMKELKIASLCWDLGLGHPRYEAGVLTSHPQFQCTSLYPVSIRYILSKPISV
jgi:hypothetical protein